MLRSLSRAIVVSALVAAPAGAQFGGQALGGAAFNVSGGDRHIVEHPTVSNGLTRIDEHPGSNVVAAPEPASMVLLATGLVGVFGLARRKRDS